MRQRLAATVRSWLWILILVALSPEGHAQEEATVSLAEARGGLLYRTAAAGRFVPAPVLDTEVHLEISGLIVRGSVRQLFRNDSDRWLEGIYVFLLPEDAAVDSLHLVIGERVIEGQIQERRQAAATYAKAKKEGKKASLVEQERPNIFTTSVANIGPGEEVTVRIEYQQVARYDSGRFSLRFPMVVGPRYIPGTSLAGDPFPDGPEAGWADECGESGESSGGGARVASYASYSGTGWALATDQVPDAHRITPPVLPPGEELGSGAPALSLSVTLQPGFELASLDSPSHPIRVEPPRNGVYVLELAAGLVLPDRDFELVWEPHLGHLPQAALFSEEAGSATFALLMVLPPAASMGAPRLPRETVLVIDTSGSMHGASIVQAKAALEEALDRLGPGDTFNVIRFSSTASSLFPRPRPVSAESLGEARAFVGSLQAEGGTEMQGALEAALAGDVEEGRLRQVIFVTDGAVGNEAELFSYIEQNLGPARLFPAAIGSAPNGHFMRRAARFGRGIFTYVASPAQVEERMEELFAKLESPQLASVAVDWPDSGTEVWPQRLPDLYQGEPLVVTARIPGAGGEATVRGRRGDSPWHAVLRLEGGAPAAGVGKLWARRKIEALMDEGTRGRDGDEVRSQVVEVALEHHLVSRYTSLVAVDVTPSRPESAEAGSAQVPVPMPLGWSHEAAFGSLPQGATPAPALMRFGVALMLLSLALALLPMLRRIDGRWPVGGRGRR